MSALVETRDISVERNGARILDGVSLTANGGEFIGLIGPNGAGKTTLLRSIAGLETSHAGECLMKGEDVAKLAPVARARAVSYLPQLRPIYWSMPVEAIVALGRFAYGAPSRLQGEDAAAAARAIEAAGVAHLQGRAATELSGGESARVHLARALAAETPILLADEPTAALDPRHQIAIMKLLRERADAGGLVIAALHDLQLAARYCTRIILLEDGRVRADGGPSAVLTAGNLSRAFGVSAAIARDERGLVVSFLD
jgi:iron complex transport system ATP-binding protein